MKIWRKALVAATVLAAPSMAQAAYLIPGSSIQFVGYLSANGDGTGQFVDSTALDFSAVAAYALTTGSLSPISPCFGTCGTMNDVSFTPLGTPSANPLISFTLSNGATTILTFTTTSISTLTRSLNTNTLSFTATGLLSYAGFNPTPALLAISSQTSISTQLSTSFSGSLTALMAVPEMATWAMMVAGFGAVGGAMRRKAMRARVQFPA